MKAFTKFITEAKIARNDLDRAALVFKKQAEKKFNTKFYRYGGDHGYVDVKDGIGILYLYGKGKAVRLNYAHGSIGTVTLWKDYKLGQKGDYTIDLDGMSILEAGKHVLEIMKAPKIGTIEMYPEVYTESLNEAKRVSPSDFMALAAEHLPPGTSLSSLSWNQITDIATRYDINIPYVIRETKVAGTKGANAKFDLTKLGEVQGADEVPKEGGPKLQYFVKVTAQDVESKKFISVKQDKTAASMLSKFQDALKNPNVEREMKDPDTLFGLMAGLVKIVSRGSRNSLVITGGPGIGKSWVVMKTIEGEGLRKNEDFIVVKGRVTTSSLYQTLFMHREGKLLVFDDCDSVWGDQDSANLLKAALDSYDVRTISWISGRTVNVSKMDNEAREEFNAALDAKIDADPDDRSIKFPSSFDFNSRIIFISNLEQKDIDSAVLNRSAKIDMTMTKDQIFQRMESILDNIGSKDVPREVKTEILNFLKSESEKGTINGASMRTYVAAEDLYRSGIENWKDYLEFV